MVKTIHNMNKYTNQSAQIGERWIGTNFVLGAYDPYNPVFEKNTTHVGIRDGEQFEHFYQKNGSFMNLGGYVHQINVHAQNLSTSVAQVEYM